MLIIVFPFLSVEYRQNRQDKHYPIREVLQIVRIKRIDGTEWLKSKGRIVGLDKLGNEIEHSFTDPAYENILRFWCS
jgi:hypothetical protein